MIKRRVKEFVSNDYCSLFRPCLVNEIVGQKTSKRLIENGLENNNLPHSLLFVGPSGCGKTTAARIVALGLNCKNKKEPTSTPCLECSSCSRILSNSSTDVIEINVGKEGGKADVEAVIQKLEYAPFDLRYKVLIFDEAHKLTDAAKDLLLKPIEDGLEYVYFIFCTNQPDKLVKVRKKEGTPFVDRCTTLFFDRVVADEMFDLLKNICIFEGISYKKEILDFIIEEAEGIPRKAIKWLEQVILEKSWSKDILATIIGTVEENNESVQALCRNLSIGKFRAALTNYDGIKNTITPESLRIIIALYFSTCLRNGNSADERDAFAEVLNILLQPIYQEGKIGNMHLIHYLYKVSRIMSGFRRNQ